MRDRRLRSNGGISGGDRTARVVALVLLVKVRFLVDRGVWVKRLYPNSSKSSGASLRAVASTLSSR